MDATQKTIKKILALSDELQAVKPYYDEIDSETLSLVGKKIPKTIEHEGETFSLELVDNFAEKNTSFKAVGVRRYQLKFKKVKKPSEACEKPSSRKKKPAQEVAEE